MSIKVDTSNFNRAIREMSRLTGAEYEDIVRAEVASVLSAAIAKTPRATKASVLKSLGKWVFIKESSPARKPQSRLTGGTAYLVGPGRNGYHHYPDYIWAWINASKDERQKELFRRIGTAKKSWYLLARQLGLKLPKSVPGYVSAAKVKGRDLDGEVSHSRRVSGDKVGISIENATKAAIQGGGRKALLSAINGRVGYFHRNMRKGVFKKVSTVAAKYPGFKIKGL